MILKHILPFFGGYSFDMIAPNLLDAYKMKRIKECQAKGIIGHRAVNLTKVYSSCKDRTILLCSVFMPLPCRDEKKRSV